MVRKDFLFPQKEKTLEQTLQEHYKSGVLMWPFEVPKSYRSRGQTENPCTINILSLTQVFIITTIAVTYTETEYFDY